MKKFFLLTLVASLVFASCGQKKKSIVGLWELKSIANFKKDFAERDHITPEQSKTIEDFCKKAGHDGCEDLLKIFAEPNDKLEYNKKEGKRQIFWNFDTTTNLVTIQEKDNGQGKSATLNSYGKSKWELKGDSVLFAGWSDQNGAPIALYIEKCDDNSLVLQTSIFPDAPFQLIFEKAKEGAK